MGPAGSGSGSSYDDTYIVSYQISLSGAIKTNYDILVNSLLHANDYQSSIASLSGSIYSLSGVIFHNYGDLFQYYLSSINTNATNIASLSGVIYSNYNTLTNSLSQTNLYQTGLSGKVFENYSALFQYYLSSISTNATNIASLSGIIYNNYNTLNGSIMNLNYDIISLSGRTVPFVANTTTNVFGNNSPQSKLSLLKTVSGFIYTLDSPVLNRALIQQVLGLSDADIGLIAGLSAGVTLTVINGAITGFVCTTLALELTYLETQVDALKNAVYKLIDNIRTNAMYGLGIITYPLHEPRTTFIVDNFKVGATDNSTTCHFFVDGVTGSTNAYGNLYANHLISNNELSVTTTSTLTGDVGLGAKLYVSRGTYTNDRQIILYDNGNSTNNYCGFQVTQQQLGSTDSSVDYHSNASSIYSGHRFYAGATLIANLQNSIMNFNTNIYKLNGSNVAPSMMLIDNLNQPLANNAKIVLFSDAATPNTYPFCAISTGYNAGQNGANDSYMNYYCKGNTVYSGHSFFSSDSANSYPILTVQPNILTHYGVQSYLSTKGPTGHSTYIGVVNNNTGQSNSNESVYLQFKANSINNDYYGDASITVTGSILGGQDNGRMFINANQQLNLGLTSENINIGTQVAYNVNTNFINIGNQYSNVFITGALHLSQQPAQINVNRMRQFL